MFIVISAFSSLHITGVAFVATSYGKQFFFVTTITEVIQKPESRGKARPNIVTIVSLPPHSTCKLCLPPHITRGQYSYTSS